MAWTETAAVAAPPQGAATPPRDETGAPRPRRLQVPTGWLEQVAGMLILGWRAMLACLTPPYSWRDDFVDQSFTIVKRCTFPVIVSAAVFGFGTPGMQLGNLLVIFGSVDRAGSAFVMASVREFAPWINGMVIAGVAGTAVCADLGARKVRDELDALAVMGIDAVRTVVAPRFLALGVVTALMNLITIVVGIMSGWFASVVVLQGTTAGFLETFSSNFTAPDLFASVIKTSTFGLIIGVVCCYKGMHAKGGPEGVGRAVNQAVVVSFAAIWIFNYVFTSTLLAAFPETANLH